jgi:hypothetical protein
MTWVDIPESIVDANSPVDENLMNNKIKNNLDDLNDRVEDLEGGTGGGTGDAGIDFVENNIELDQQDIDTVILPNSISESFADAKIDLQGYLMNDASSTDDEIGLGWNVKYPNTSDKDMDSTTGWATADAGTSLTTDGTTKKLSTNSLKFSKAGTAVRATIYRTSSDTDLSNNSMVFFWINLSTI